MLNMFDGPPDFVNPQGVKWWKDTLSTQYAREPNVKGTALDAYVFFIEEPNGRKTRVMVERHG